MNLSSVKIYLTRSKCVCIESFKNKIFARKIGDGDHFKVRIIDSGPTGNFVSAVTSVSSALSLVLLLFVQALLQLLQQGRFQLFKQR